MLKSTISACVLFAVSLPSSMAKDAAQEPMVHHLLAASMLEDNLDKEILAE